MSCMKIGIKPKSLRLHDFAWLLKNTQKHSSDLPHKFGETQKGEKSTSGYTPLYPTVFFSDTTHF